MAHFIAFSEGKLESVGFSARCALGRCGVKAAAEKREGDDASPAGIWPVRRVWYRPDKGPAPETGIPVIAIRPGDGWCDEADHPLYNRPVSLPFPASHERMWRGDDLYNLVVELGYNDDPPLAGRGSAIFMHLARPGYLPTEGCIALTDGDLREVVKRLTGRSAIEIRV